MSIPPTLDLTELRQRWQAQRAPLREILSRIDVTGMTRPARDADERAWLDARGETGVFGEDEASAAAARAYYAKKYRR